MFILPKGRPMVWFSGSGGTGETSSPLSRNFWQNVPARERRREAPPRSTREVPEG